MVCTFVPERKKKDIQELGFAEIMKVKREKFEKCNIIFTAHFEGKRKHDPDNLYAKPYLDALVQAKVIKDDNNSIVKSVILIAISNEPRSYIEIEIKKL